MTQSVGILCGDKIWKQVFSCGLILITFSVIFLSSFAHVFAQNVPPQIQNGSNINYGPTTGGPYSGPGPVPNGTGGNGGALTPAQQAAIDGVTGADPASDAAAREATQETPTVVVGEIDDPILKVLHAIVVTGLGWLVGMFGYLFDFSVNYFIIGFGDQFVNYNVGSTVNDLWATVRDIFNLTFIFGLVFIGFKMILDSSDSNARKMLVSLIAAALLVNFSLFITKFIVDFSNIAAFQVYKAFSGSAAGTYSITEGFMNLMGIRSLIGVTYVESGAGGYQYIIGLLVVFLVLAYVFLAGAIMIIVRFALLTIYMIFSPIMFLGWVFPSMKGKSSEYWSGFLGQAFFAPAFIFMLYLSYKVADSYKFGQKSFEHLFNTSGGRGVLTPTIGGIDPTVPYFAMVIVFLVASIVVAKSIGNTSAKFGMSISGKVLGGATAGLAARAGRTAIGGSASALANNKYFQRVAANSYIGKQMYRATANVADRSFDARQVGGVGKKLGLGDGKKGGFNTRAKESAEIDKKILASFAKNSIDDDPDVKKFKAKVEKAKLALSNARDDDREELQNKLDIANTELKDAEKAFTPEKMYATHLSYIKTAERWQNTQKALLGKMAAATVAVGTGIATGGIAPALAAGAAFAVVGKGLNQHTKKDVEAMRKSYGKDGSKKKEAEAQEAKLKDLAKILEETGEKKGDKK